MFEIGQLVRIRQWDDMEREFGLSERGNIACPCNFTSSMRYLCGQVFTVFVAERATFSDTFIYQFTQSCGYTISEQMLEPVDTKGFKVGDYAKIRSWKEMKKEFGTCPAISSHLNTPGLSFLRDMKRYCGLVGKIKSMEVDDIFDVIRVKFEDNPVLETAGCTFTTYMIKKARRIE